MPPIRLSKAETSKYAHTAAQLLFASFEEPVNHAMTRYQRRHPGAWGRLQKALSPNQCFWLFYEVAEIGFRQYLNGAFAVAKVMHDQKKKP